MYAKLFHSLSKLRYRLGGVSSQSRFIAGRRQGGEVRYVTSNMYTFSLTAKDLSLDRSFFQSSKLRCPRYDYSSPK